MFSKLVDRNNTSFPKELMEVMKKIKQEENDPLRYHQRLVVDYFLEYKIRGLLVYHNMGAGKTIVAVACAVEMMIRKYKVVFLASKSLHNNFKDDIRKYHGISEDFQRKYPDVEKFIDTINFITSNASNSVAKLRKVAVNSLIDQDEDTPLVLENVYLICDEAHNFFNSISNESKNAMQIYNAIMRTKHMGITFLTGNPIVNSPFEIFPAFNMLAGKIEGKTLFSTNYQEVMKQFVSDPKAGDDPNETSTIPRIKNADKFSDRIFGLVSYFGADNEEQLALLPKKYQTMVEVIPMSSAQYVEYAAAREKELRETSMSMGASAGFGKPQGGGAKTYRVASRQACNISYPDHAYSLDPIKKKKVKDPTLLTTEDLTTNLHIIAPKFKKMMRTISMHSPAHVLPQFKPTEKQLARAIEKANKANNMDGWTPGIGKGIMYSQFNKAGLLPFGKALEAHGMRRIETVSDALSYSSSADKKGSYVILSGEMETDDRKLLLDMYNSVENDDGSIIMFLMVSVVGAEGINTKSVRYSLQTEPYWHYSRAAQFEARAVRPLSHERLPEEERNVQPYFFLMNYPIEILEVDDPRREMTTDMQLYYNSIQNQVLIESFNKVMQESSIDCTMHYMGKKDCRLCNPTGKTLWVAGIADLAAPSPCTRLTEKKITAESVVYDGIEYMYHITNGRIHIFSYVPELDSYKEIFPDHKNYEQLYVIIANKHNISY